jgi:hypothetical protein
MAIIGGYVARNAQNVTAIQANAAQLGEGNANIAYELGRLHLVEPDQFVGGNVQPYYEQGYYYQDHQHQPLVEDKEDLGTLVFFSFLFLCNLQLLFMCVCVIFSIFI